MTDQPPTEQQLDEIETRANAATPGPWKRSEDYSDVLAPDGSQLASYWLAADGEFIAHAPDDVRVLLAEVRRQRAELAAEQRSHGDTIDDRDRAHEIADKLAYAVAPEEVIGEHSSMNCPWTNALDLITPKAEVDRLRDRVAELETYAYGCDAEGCVLPHSSWCDAAKKTAAANEGCTCGQPWSGHPQPHAMHCWTVNPPRAEVEEMRKRIAELSAAVAPDAASEATSAPLSPVQPSSVSESAQSPTGAPTGHLGDLPSTEDLASADNPTQLRWGLNDVQWCDDDSVIVMLSGPDREPYWLELDPERAAVLREDLAGPDGAPSADRDTLIAELLPAWEAMYEPGNVSTYLIGYANDEAPAKAAAEAWLRSQSEVTGRLEWEQWSDAATLPDGYDALFELIQRHDDGIDTGPGIAVRRRVQPTAAAEETGR